MFIFYLSKLVDANSQSDAVFADLRHSTDTTDAPFIFGKVRRPAERTFLLSFASVDGRVGVTAQVERVVLVVSQLQLVGQVRIARLQNFPRLRGHVRSRTKF